MAQQDSGSISGPAKQIDRLIMPLFALLLMLGIVSFVSIFADHSGGSAFSLTGQAVASYTFDMPRYETPAPPPRYELKEIGPNLVESHTHVLLNLFGKNFRSDTAQIVVNIYTRPYFGGYRVMQFKSAVHTDNRASFWLPEDLEPGNYFISVGEGNRESLRKQITVK